MRVAADVEFLHHGMGIVEDDHAPSEKEQIQIGCTPLPGYWR
jgi:hypothetical protein